MHIWKQLFWAMHVNWKIWKGAACLSKQSKGPTLVWEASHFGILLMSSRMRKQGHPSNVEWAKWGIKFVRRHRASIFTSHMEDTRIWGTMPHLTTCNSEFDADVLFEQKARAEPDSYRSREIGDPSWTVWSEGSCWPPLGGGGDHTTLDQQERVTWVSVKGSSCRWIDFAWNAGWFYS